MAAGLVAGIAMTGVGCSVETNAEQVVPPSSSPSSTSKPETAPTSVENMDVEVIRQRVGDTTATLKNGTAERLQGKSCVVEYGQCYIGEDDNGRSYSITVDFQKGSASYNSSIWGIGTKPGEGYDARFILDQEISNIPDGTTITTEYIGEHVEKDPVNLAIFEGYNHDMHFKELTSNRGHNNYHIYDSTGNGRVRGINMSDPKFGKQLSAIENEARELEAKFAS